ncbi:MAG: aspartate aminotransferase family protein, partial [Planctomycetota bacterium]
LPPCNYSPSPYNGPSLEEVLQTRQKYINPAVFLYYQNPIMIVEGYMQYLFDHTGKRYLDLIGGIVTISVGHRHPKVMEKIKQQLDKLQHATTIYLHPNMGLLAKKLAQTTPEGLDVVYFVNSGSEANDLAILMARLYTGNYDILAMQNAYHGAVTSVLGLTSHHTWKPPIPHQHGIHHVPCPDLYRNPFSGTDEERLLKSAQEIQNIIHYSTCGKIAGLIAEPIHGVGGVTELHPTYLQKAYEIVRKHGGLCISDEVQTGFGRTGDHYWGFQNLNVTPDIITLAKGLGNGTPVAAVITRKEIAQTLAKKIHFNTYGGNPVSMAAGLAVMEVIEEENLQENCRNLGKYFKEELKKLQNKHPHIGDVRGKGLMLGVELVKNQQTKEPATEEAKIIAEKTKDMALLLGRGGLYGNVLRLKPPMCITKEDVDYALAVLDKAFEELKS